MCDYVPGRLVLAHETNDTAIGIVLENAGREGLSVEQRMADKLAPFHKSVDPRLKLDFSLLRVPEGDEVWWISQITARYFSNPGKDPSLFSVSLDHQLEPCGLTFTFGHHDATYRTLMRENLSTGDGSGVKVKIIDSGLSTSAGVTAASEVNILDPSKPTDVEDHNGHGTAVAEIVHGLAPKAEFLIYKVKASAPISEWDVLAALCDNDAADVVNLSLGFGLATKTCVHCGRQSHSARSAVFEGTLRRMAAVNQNTLIVAAAGNGGTNPLIYPARFREAIAVGAVDSAANRSSTSNYGNLDHKKAVHDSLFFAPGGSPTEAVGNTSNGNSYNGTSFATAYVSGLLAKLKSDPAYAGSASTLLQTLRTKANQNPAMNGFVANDHGHGLIQI